MKYKTSFTTLVTALAAWAITVGTINVAPNALAGGPGGGDGGGGGGGGGGGTVSGTQAIANVLRGPWEALVVDTVFTATFNNNGTFTATIQASSGTITTDSGTWTLTPPVAPSGFNNPQAHLVLIDKQGAVLLSGDVLLINKDQLVMLSATNSLSEVSLVSEVILTRLTI